MTIAELQKEFLASGSWSIAPEDFFILLAHSLRKEKVFVIAHPEYVMERESESCARTFFAERAAGKPVALITGHKAFYGRDFFVTKDTLIPRPETELLVELALSKAESRIPARPAGGKNQESRERKTLIADIGTGSGNIIISLALELRKITSRSGIEHSGFTFHATDISEQAVSVAKKNAKQYGVADSIEFHIGDLLKPLSKELLATGEVIITANLPYLSVNLYESAPKDVRLFEPKNALVSGKTGMDHYTRLLEDASNFFPRQSTLSIFLEISPEQSTHLKTIASLFFPGALIRIHRDLANKARILEIHRKKSNREANDASV